MRRPSLPASWSSPSRFASSCFAWWRSKRGVHARAARPETANPLGRDLASGALVAFLVVSLVALSAACVRVLPWLLDRDVPWSVAEPFARSVGTLALEASLLLGWPLGWMLAAQAFLERGEGRVLASLGEAPSRTTLRLLGVAAAFAVALSLLSARAARDARAPGEVVAALLDRGRETCAAARVPGTVSVPSLGATWLCSGASHPELPPRLVARPFGLGLGGGGDAAPAVFTAAGAHVSPHLDGLELDDARVDFGPVQIQIGHARVRHFASFVRPSVLAAWVRPVAMALGGALSALLGVHLLLVGASRGSLGMRAGAARAFGFASFTPSPGRVGALIVGAAGPIAVLATWRALEGLTAPAAIRFADMLGPLVVGAVALGATGVVSLLTGSLQRAFERG